MDSYINMEYVNVKSNSEDENSSLANSSIMAVLEQSTSIINSSDSTISFSSSSSAAKECWPFMMKIVFTKSMSNDQIKCERNIADLIKSSLKINASDKSLVRFDFQNTKTPDHELVLILSFNFQSDIDLHSVYDLLEDDNTRQSIGIKNVFLLPTNKLLSRNRYDSECSNSSIDVISEDLNNVLLSNPKIVETITNFSTSSTITSDETKIVSEPHPFKKSTSTQPVLLTNSTHQNNTVDFQLDQSLSESDLKKLRVFLQTKSLGAGPYEKHDFDKKNSILTLKYRWNSHKQGIMQKRFIDLSFKKIRIYPNEPFNFNEFDEDKSILILSGLLNSAYEDDFIEKVAEVLTNNNEEAYGENNPQVIDLMKSNIFKGVYYVFFDKEYSTENVKENNKNNDYFDGDLVTLLDAFKSNTLLILSAAAEKKPLDINLVDSYLSKCSQELNIPSHKSIRRRDEFLLAKYDDDIMLLKTFLSASEHQIGGGENNDKVKIHIEPYLSNKLLDSYLANRDCVVAGGLGGECEESPRSIASFEHLFKIKSSTSHMPSFGYKSIDMQAELTNNDRLISEVTLTFMEDKRVRCLFFWRDSCEKELKMSLDKYSPDIVFDDTNQKILFRCSIIASKNDDEEIINKEIKQFLDKFDYKTLLFINYGLDQANTVIKSYSHNKKEVNLKVIDGSTEKQNDNRDIEVEIYGLKERVNEMYDLLSKEAQREKIIDQELKITPALKQFLFTKKYAQKLMSENKGLEVKLQPKSSLVFLKGRMDQLERAIASIKMLEDQIKIKKYSIDPFALPFHAKSAELIYKNILTQKKIEVVALFKQKEKEWHIYYLADQERDKCVSFFNYEIQTFKHPYSSSSAMDNKIEKLKESPDVEISIDNVGNQLVICGFVRSCNIAYEEIKSITSSLK